MPTPRTKRIWQATSSWDKRTEQTTSWDIRVSPVKVVWIDYLYGDNQWVSAIVEDQDWNDISIYANSWYEQVGFWTQWTKRSSI